MVDQPARVEAIDRALTLLTALAEAGPAGASLGALAGTAGINKTTAHRALTTLRQRGFATQDEEGSRYALGPAALALSAHVDAPANLAEALHPALVALSRASGELVHLGVLTGHSIRYLDKVEPTRAIRVWSSIGKEVAVGTTSMGRALLAARRVPDAHLASYAASPDDLHHLREAVHRARDLGYAVERGENEPEVGCLGTAILRGETAVAAVSITTPATELTGARERDLASLIRRTLPPLLPAGLTLPEV